MKKFRLVELIGIIMILSCPVKAQFKYGFTAGMDITNVHFNKDYFAPSAIVGYNVGVTSEYIFPVLGIGFDISVLFADKGFEQKSTTYRKNYIDIPVNFKWKFNLPLVQKGYLSAGPYYSKIIGKEKTWSVKPSQASTNNASISPLEDHAGIHIGAGVDIFKWLQVGINYSHEFSDGYKVTYTGKTSYGQSRGWGIKASYLF
ncbi:MAG: PorT family protein [Tannerellaceae bacterium]|nr:PorT family protein [Tannerellaceae bacterium]